MKKGGHIKLRVQILVERDGDGFMAYCPELQGFLVGGSTIEEIKKNTHLAMQGYFASLIKHDDPIPIGIIDNTSPDTPWWKVVITKIQEGLKSRKNAFVEEVCIPFDFAKAA